jgi:hypothetical protein
MKRPWKEKTVRLEQATIVIFEGPGTEWTCVLRGTRPENQPASGRRRRPTRRRKREGHA